MMITKTQSLIGCMDDRDQVAQVHEVYQKKGSLQMNLLRLVPLRKLMYLVNTQTRRVDSMAEQGVAQQSTLRKTLESDL